MPDLWIGCSGFSYQHWRGRFYPQDLPQRRWFEFYCSRFPSLELNATFYRLPNAETVERWFATSPPGFLFSVKGSRFITHVKKIFRTAQPEKLFFGRALLLKEKLGAVLWQFSPSFRIDVERLTGFLRRLKQYPVRNVLEFRHESWITESVIEICREHNVALCKADWPTFLINVPETADFVYVRRHGRGGSYATRYTRAELEDDAKRIRRYSRAKKDVFIYFNNDAYGYAPANALELTSLLRQ